MSDTLKRIHQVFQTVFDDEDLAITEKTSANDIEAWDSLQHINILSMLEKEFQIEFDIDQIIVMENVGDMISVIDHIMKK